MIWRFLRFFNRLVIPLSLLLVVLVAGTVGYMIIEDYNFLDAIYMTVITVASVGYGEVNPLSEDGKIFTTILISVNLLAFTLFIAYITRVFLDSDFIRQYKLYKMQSQIDQLRDHVIICGFGRNGKEAARVLSGNNIPFVVIENHHNNFSNLDYEVPFHLHGDATQDDVLIQAGIERAKAFLSTLPNDADNVYAVLTARQLNPAIKIISRASNDSSVNKLKVAGASNVIMPDKIGGTHMATLVMIPDVVELISVMTTRNGENFSIQEVQCHKDCILGEINLWRKTGCTVLGIKKEKDYLINPDPEFQLHEGDRIIVMGSSYQLERAREVLGN